MIVGDQGPRRRLAGAGRVRSLRRRAGRTGVDQPGFADLVELVRTGKALRENLRRLSGLETRPDYADVAPLARALIAANSDAHRLGHRLAASGFGHSAGTQADRRDAAVADRRRPSAQSAPGMGAGCGDPQKDSGRQSGEALRILRAGSQSGLLALSERFLTEAVTSHRPCAIRRMETDGIPAIDAVAA